MSSVPSCRQRKPLNRRISWIRALSKNWTAPDLSTGYTSRNGFLNSGPTGLLERSISRPKAPGPFIGLGKGFAEDVQALRRSPRGHKQAGQDSKKRALDAITICYNP